MGWLSAAFDVGKRVVNAFTAPARGAAEHEAKKDELKYNIELLGQQINALDTTYNNNVDQLEASRDQAIASNNFNIAITGKEQKEQANMAAVANVESQSLMYDELQTLQEQGLVSVGSAVNTAATSGFRNTEGSSVDIAINAVEEEAERSYETQKRKVQLSSYQSYMAAASDYFSANVQMEGYRQAIRNTNEDFSLKYKALTDEYENNRTLLEAQQANYQAEYDSMGDYGFWDGVRDFFGGLF